MERLKWRERETSYNYNYAYKQKEILYECPKCGHVFDNVTTVPFKCSTCTADLNNVSTLIPEANQDMRVKFFANGAL